MKKQKSLGDKLNIAVTTFCLLVCCGLISSMLLFAGAEATATPGEKNKLKEVNIMEQQQVNTFLSEEYIATTIGKYIPQGIPSENIKVNIKADGTVYVAAIADRGEIEALVSDSLGIREKLFLKLLPKKFEMGIQFTASNDPESGLLILLPKAFNINGMDLSVDILPEQLLRVISESINTAIIDSGFYFSKIELKDGGIDLIKE